MNKLNALLPLVALCCLLNPTFAQKIIVKNSITETGVTLTTNEVQFGMQNLVFDPNDSLPKRRFSAFWVPGDGNYIQFDESQDSLSLIPTYLYPAPGEYEATSYLTGKYTNRIPPARAAQPLTIPLFGGGAQTSSFNGRLDKVGLGTVPAIDIFSNHAIRKKNLTTFIISWPGDVNATGIYLFFNGYKNSATGEFQSFNPRVPLKYQITDVPSYFLGRDQTGLPLFDTSKIKDYESSRLQSPVPLDGIIYDPVFSGSMPNKFSKFVYFPAEKATQAEMPSGFTENRLFAVLWADSSFVPQDSFLNFLVLLTGPKPADSSNNKLSALLAQINSDLVPANRIGTSQQQDLYIQAAAELQLEYLTTFDPNQLTVENVTQLGGDEYEVTFRLEMCNKGRGVVEKEDVSLTFPTNFHDFTPVDFTPVSSTLAPGLWQFAVDKVIPGVEVDSVHEESECVSITFKAKTNCEGLRSLWKSAVPTPVQSCVVFDGGIVNTPPECHAATAIDSTQFGGFCSTSGTSTCCDWDIFCCWPLCLLLILVLLFIIWWAYKRYNS